MMSRVRGNAMSNQANSLKNMYSAETLKEIALWAKVCQKGRFGDQEFSKIQKAIIESRFSDFSFDYLTTSTIVCDDKMLPAATDVLCLDVDEALAEGYIDVAHLDDVSPVSYVNLGRVILSDIVRPFKEWVNHPLYIHHCSKFDIARTLTISFQHPDWMRTYLAFEYIATSSNNSWQNISHAQLELATFPFALAWFYRKGFMDDAALSYRFMALEGLTEAQLTHIRKYVNSPESNFKTQASDLGISAYWLKENLYNVRDKLASKMKWERRPAKKTQNSLKSLASEYRYFEMLGDPTESIWFPKVQANP